MNKKADYFFEASWEVCNKVGGIYTVVQSKVMPMQSYYDKNYCLIGPYILGSKLDEFKEKMPPDNYKDIFEKLHKIGIKCHFGTWRTEGDPNVILIDYSGYTYKVNEIKTDNWTNFKIDTLGTQYHDYDEPISWSTCAGILLEEIKKSLPDRIICAQFHEWLSGGGILYLKSRKVRIGTIFTTHATMLGRTLAGNHVDLYNLLGKINPEEYAYKYGVQSKHLTEKACAQNADAFTTVSEITGIEAGFFLGKKPDVLLPNGLDIERFPTFDEASVKHKMLKAKIKKFLVSYFFPYYQFNLDNTLLYFMAGRYEFHDKGIDLFIKALGKLNSEMKKDNSDKSIVAFIWVPNSIKEIRPEILQSKNYYQDVDDTIHDMLEEIKDKMIYGIMSKKELTEDFLLGESVKRQLEKTAVRFSLNGNPSLCTHNLYNEQNDEMMNALKQNGLLNSKEDKVKVILYPIYLTGADQLIDLSYYEAIMACHLGVFPSYYEPWGYTPMEAGALGVASVTTDLSGFGKYLQQIAKEEKKPGIYVLKRLNRKDDDVAEDLYKVFSDYKNLTHQERIENKLRAKSLADTCDWKILAENYIKAHDIAAAKNG